MADHLVTGIAPTSDPQQLEQSLLQHCRLNVERLAVVTKVKQSAAHDRSALRFIHAGTGGGSHAAVAGSMTATIMSGSTGTGVPGISGSNASLSSFSGGAHAPNYLGDLPVPHDVAGNYNIAIDEGRSVVAYRADAGEAPDVEQAFRACGLRNVKTFRPKVTSGMP